MTDLRTPRRLLASSFLLAALGAGPALADGPMLGATVAGLIEHARLHNPDFAAQRAEAEAAHERIEPAGALPDPKFQIELMDTTNTMRGGRTTILPGEVGETRYRVVQSFPAWGKRELDVRAATARAGRADAGREAVWLELSASIKAAWLRYYAADAADREAVLNRDALRLLQGLEEITLSRYRLGLLPQQAVLRAQREITAQRLSLVAVEQRRRTATAALNALLARTPGSPLAAPAEPAPLADLPPIDQLLTHTRDRNPLLAAEAAGVKAARFERDRTWRDRYPDFSIGLTNNRPRGGESSWDLMFEVMIPLQQSARRAREREATYMLTAADARRDAAEAKLHGELGSAHAAYTAGHDTLRLLRGTLLPQAEATRDASRSAFSAGSVDFDTVLEAERQLVDTRLALLQADLDTRLALTELEKIAGDLP
ncbi:MAG: transporter [Betaproteobacteria bacterium HGW-Betaproteobacteria-13]|nr:MAG: transporter [Betaproteobacteria bacterium HGW-Betaproteobacteria-13]